MARVALVVTLYIHDAESWEHGLAEACCRQFFDICPPANLRWFTTSRLDKWHCLEPETVSEVLHHLTWTEQQPRHCFGFWLADEPGAPSCAFVYRSIDPAVARRAGYVQLVIPQDTDPGLLWQATLGMAHELPFTCGIGGFGATFNRLYPQTAFHEIRAWARRFYGLDVQEPERMGWHVATALPGTNWLTLLGPGLLEAWGETAEQYTEFAWQTPGTLSLPLGAGGVLIRAGESPTLGDLNRLVYPDAYAEIARHFAERLPEDPTSFTGGFFEHGDTADWLRRFVEPDGWR